MTNYLKNYCTLVKLVDGIAIFKDKTETDLFLVVSDLDKDADYTKRELYGAEEAAKKLARSIKYEPLNKRTPEDIEEEYKQIALDIQAMKKFTEDNPGVFEEYRRAYNYTGHHLGWDINSI